MLEEGEVINSEAKREADLYYNEQLISNDEGKPGRLSEEVRHYNKQRNHFSKSTAEESDLGVKDLECLLEERDGQPNTMLEGFHAHTINNRKSKSVASQDFI